MGDGRLCESDYMYLMSEACRMYVADEKERRITADWCEGRLSTNNAVDVLGCFSGQRFDAELETDLGKVHVRFLLHNCQLMHSIDDTVN